MAAPPPSLSLSDIMHPLSPPPAPVHHKPFSPPRPGSSTPEPLEPAEIEEMRRKVLSMGWGDLSTGKEKASSAEQELADMLLRLTHPASLPQPSQLHAQAETISHIIQQRDFLVQRSMEEHERWESEREGWARSAQALIIQGRRESAQAEKEDAVAAQYATVTTDAATQRLQEFERANATLQNDKKILQQKLTNMQHRLASLESELAQLKPLLLMQPFTLTHSHPTGTPRGWSAVLPSPSTPASSRRQRGEQQLYDDDDADHDSDDERPRLSLHPRGQLKNSLSRPVSHEQSILQSSSPPTSPHKPKVDYYRRRDVTVQYPHGQSTKSGRRNKAAATSGGAIVPNAPSKPTLSDARAEHLLLAARKIGRQRAAILSGVFGHIEQQPQEQPAPPPPPSHHRQKTAPSSPSKAQQQHPAAPKTPRRGNANNVTTPLLTRTPLGHTGASPAQLRTPLQSLLSAAQSVLSTPGCAASSTTTPESPLPKRRKLDHGVTTVGQDANTSPSFGLAGGRKDREKVVRGKEREKERGRASTSGGVARVKSALDFLADQAEVYGTQPASQESLADGDSQPRDDDGASESYPDAEMVGTVSVSDDKGRFSGDLAKGKEKVVGKSISGVEAPIIGQEHRNLLDASQSDTQIQSQSQQTTFGTTPSASQATFSYPSAASLGPDDQTCPDQGLLADGDTAGHSTTTLEVQAPPPPRLTLAPPIDLTPRASRSPAPASTSPNISQQSDLNNRKKGSSPSTERERRRLPLVRALSAPAVDAVAAVGSALGSSFSMFSLQRPQSVIVSASTSTTTTRPGGRDLGESLEQEQQGSSAGSAMSTSPRIENIKFVSSDGSPRRTRSPYVKWTKEEDELLAKAVAKHGQKWDLVQKALPSRGYHQVRQRWLRKLGVFDSGKMDLSSVETNAAAEFLNISTAPHPPAPAATPGDINESHDTLSLTSTEVTRPTTVANPKLGLALLNSEKKLITASSISSTSRSGGVGRSSSWPTGET